MTTAEFKEYLKSNKESLRGRNLSISHNGTKLWFNSLNEFGHHLLSILKDTSYCSVANDSGNAFFIMDSGQPFDWVKRKMSKKESKELMLKTLAQLGTNE